MPVKPMLAKDADLSKVAWPQIAQRKLDGIRAMVQDGVVLSRTLKPIPNKAVQDALGKLEGFDGELIVGPPEHPDAYRRTTSFVMAPDKPWPDVQEPWTFHVFDLVNRPETPYALRYDRLRMAVNHIMGGACCDRKNEADYIALVENLRVNNLQELEDVERAWLLEGHEGVILRDPSGLYKHGRSGKAGPLLKVKRFVDFEAEVIGVYEEMHNANEAKTNELGRTARSSAKAGKVGKGTLGGLVLRGLPSGDPENPNPAEGVEFRCGTGFDATQRRNLWLSYLDHQGTDCHRSCAIIGRIAKIKSFPIGVKDKPRHPVFLGWRDLNIDG